MFSRTSPSVFRLRHSNVRSYRYNESLLQNITYKNVAAITDQNWKTKSVCSSSTSYSNPQSSESVLPTQAQVVIAGAGTVANSVAYHLIQNGWKDVLVLEQGRYVSYLLKKILLRCSLLLFSFHATLNFFIKLIRVGGGTSYFGSGTLGLFKPIAHRDIIMYSIKLYRQLQEMGFDIGMKECGSVNLAQTKDRMIALKRRIAYNVPTGLYCEVSFNLRNETPKTRINNFVCLASWQRRTKKATPLFTR